MRMGKGMVVGLLCLVLVFAICVPRAYSGTVTTYLDGAWFKMKLTAKGYKYDPLNDGAYQQYNFSAPVYLHLTWVPDPSNYYRVDVWTFRDAGWVKSFTINRDAKRPGENFFPNLPLIFYFGGTDGISTFHTAFISFKMNVGVLQPAKWQGTGMVFGGQFESGAKGYYGYFNLTGQKVDLDKLPFVP